MIRMCKFNSININNLITQVFIKGLHHNRTLSPHSYSVIFLQFTETSSNLATAQTAKTMLRPPSPVHVAPFTSLLDFHGQIRDEIQSEWNITIWDDHDQEQKQDEEYWIKHDNDELVTIPSSDSYLHTNIIIYARQIYSYMPTIYTLYNLL